MLPLIRNNPSCLDVKNSDGITARQLLEDFKDRMRRTHGQQHCQPEVLESSAGFKVSTGAFVHVLYIFINFISARLSL